MAFDDECFGWVLLLNLDVLCKLWGDLFVRLMCGVVI